MHFDKQIMLIFQTSQMHILLRRVKAPSGHNGWKLWVDGGTALAETWLFPKLLAFFSLKFHINHGNRCENTGVVHTMFADFWLKCPQHSKFSAAHRKDILSSLAQWRGD